VNAAAKRRIAGELYFVCAKLALEFRCPLPSGEFVPSALWLTRCRNEKLAVSAEHEDFPALLAEALDVLTACDLDPKRAGSLLRCTPSQLIKLLLREPHAFTLVNQQRAAAGKPQFR
jgi:hypothetical protein